MQVTTGDLDTFARDEALYRFGAERGEHEGRAGLCRAQEGDAFFQPGLQGWKRVLERFEEPVEFTSLCQLR